MADRLSFNTSQYFTTVFRRVSGMTPSEYAASVRSNFELKNEL
ncbi:MAG: AraC family transcriptional regulator [Clostridia bacterium]|nr:AraC family transcriptional regulator [Clostridia bacterium]